MNHHGANYISTVTVYKHKDWALSAGAYWVPMHIIIPQLAIIGIRSALAAQPPILWCCRDVTHVILAGPIITKYNKYNYP